MGVGEKLAGRSVLVTGATGFVGSHLTEKLVECGAEVGVLVESGGPGEMGNLDTVRADVTVYRGDLRDVHAVKRALGHLEGHSDAIVFHLGAQAHVGESWRRPYETVETNVTGTLNVLQSVLDLDLDVSKVLTAGSSEEYGNRRHPPSADERQRNGTRVTLDETTSVNPTSIYATSKVAADYLTMNYHDAYSLPGVTTRMFNNYGPRQSPRYITGTVISQALERDRVELGNLEPRRDMSYVTDGVRGLLDVALEGRPGEQYVFGSGELVSMREWTNLILEVGRAEGYWGEIEVVQRRERYRPGDSDVEALVADYGKLHALTGWEPTVSDRTGIRRTIEWFANNRREWRCRIDWDNTSRLVAKASDGSAGR